MSQRFADIKPTRPVLDNIEGQYDEIRRGFLQAKSATKREDVFLQWDALRRQLETWESMTDLNFHQDTTNPAYKEARDYRNAISPKLLELSTKLKQELIASPHRTELEKRYGSHLFNLWEADVTTFAPEIQHDLVEESRLCADYTELLSSAEISFEEKTLNLTGIAEFTTDPNRNRRHEATKARWAFFSDNQKTLDQTFSDLVRLRTQMARKLGFSSYIELGYKRMQRIDYNAEHVALFREQVLASVVPLCVKQRQAQQRSLGISKLMAWDEEIYSQQGNPKPQGGAQWITDQATSMFQRMGGEFEAFFDLMVSGKLLDLDNRPHKAGGGFCTSFPTHGVPFIFTNFNGTTHDIEVLTHEAGHAFQCWLSRDKPVSDYIWPTLESCEIHSMSLEFLTWPHMDLFFGDDATRFKSLHLLKSLLFLPYGVSVDHFQHLVYEQPEASPEQRHQMWQKVTSLYCPWHDPGDIPHLVAGGRWQMQRHIYQMPFYYIDYTLAQTCALQFWAMAEENRAEAMANYVSLCRLGGSRPFQELVDAAGLKSPFAAGCLENVVKRASLELSTHIEDV